MKTYEYLMINTLFNRYNLEWNFLTSVWLQVVDATLLPSFIVIKCNKVFIALVQIEGMNSLYFTLDFISYHTYLKSRKILNSSMIGFPISFMLTDLKDALLCSEL